METIEFQITDDQADFLTNQLIRYGFEPVPSSLMDNLIQHSMKIEDSQERTKEAK